MPAKKTERVDSPPRPIIEQPGDDITLREKQRKLVDATIPPESKEKVIPTVAVKLPSGGMAEVRRPEYEHERALANPALQESGDAFDIWLSGCVANINGKNGIKPEDTIQLLIGDRIFLAVKIVQLFYGDRIDFDCDCPRCGAQNQLSIDIATEIMTTCKDYPEQREFTFNLPSGRTVTYGFATGLHQRMLRGAKDISLLDGLAMRMRSLDGFPATSKTMAELDPKDRAALRFELLKNTGGGIDTIVRATCRGCGRGLATALEDNVSFFLPGLRRG